MHFHTTPSFPQADAPAVMKMPPGAPGALGVPLSLQIFAGQAAPPQMAPEVSARSRAARVTVLDPRSADCTTHLCETPSFTELADARANTSLYYICAHH